jgi:hypothetical protein
MGCNNEPHGIKMQPTIHLERKAGFGRGKNPALPAKCIVGCIFKPSGSLLLVNHLVYLIFQILIVCFFY